MPLLLSVQKIWDHSEHNAFPDLIFYRNNFYCAVRESDEHAGGRDGQVRILSSPDGKRWSAIALITRQGVDLRDPMLSETPDGRLMLSIGGSRYEGETYLGCNPCVSFSENGKDWAPVIVLDIEEEWIWRVTWHKGVGYGVSYRTNPKNSETPWVATLFKTDDGVVYIPIVKLDAPDNPSEATLRFAADDTMVALLRRQAPGYIGHSKPPYTQWTWTDIGFRVGGPNFLILPDGKMWAGSRLIAREDMRRTTLARMSSATYEPELILPSGGDTSYPGMVYRNGLLYMTYYSSHEEKAMIYLATIDLEK